MSDDICRAIRKKDAVLDAVTQRNLEHLKEVLKYGWRMLLPQDPDKRTRAFELACQHDWLKAVKFLIEQKSVNWGSYKGFMGQRVQRYKVNFQAHEVSQWTLQELKLACNDSSSGDNLQKLLGSSVSDYLPKYLLVFIGNTGKKRTRVVEMADVTAEQIARLSRDQSVNDLTRVLYQQLFFAGESPDTTRQQLLREQHLVRKVLFKQKLCRGNVR